VRISRKHERQIVPSAERTPAPRPIRPSSKSAVWPRESATRGHAFCVRDRTRSGLNSQCRC